MPTDAVFATISQHMSVLIQSAWAQSIAIASPSLLLPALKTVASLWLLERQTRSAADIVEAARQAYDKCRVFIEKYESVGKNLETALNTFHESKTTLKDGKGNFLGQVLQLQKLGFTPKKDISAEYRDDDESEKMKAS